MPIGSIVVWSGDDTDIPEGWQIADGTNGTRDLRTKFVWGAGLDLTVGQNGGARNHGHPFTGNGHAHESLIQVDVAGAGPSQAWNGPSDSESAQASGTTDAENHLPPWFVLFWIQRIS